MQFLGCSFPGVRVQIGAERPIVISATTTIASAGESRESANFFFFSFFFWVLSFFPIFDGSSVRARQLVIKSVDKVPRIAIAI